MSTKQEYLKRYLSPEKAGKKKKKKKSTEQQGKSRLTIVDADVDLRISTPPDNGKVNSDEDDEDEAPLIAAVIDERPEHVKKLEAYRADPRWKTIADKEDNINAALSAKQRTHGANANQSALKKQYGDSDSDQSPVRKQRRDSDSDQSPVRKQRRDSDDDQSPVRKQRHDSDSDQSPVRKQRHDSDSDQSPVRKCPDSDSDQSPLRKQHHGSDSDQSPVRKQCHNLDSGQPRMQHSASDQALAKTKDYSYKDNDLSNRDKMRDSGLKKWSTNKVLPSSNDRILTTVDHRHSFSHDQLPIRKPHRSDNNQSLARKASQRSDSDHLSVRRKPHKLGRDHSPVSRKRHASDSDQSPVRRKRHASDSDQSPVRRKRHESDSDQSPVRRKRHESDSDQSPVRRKRHESDSDQSRVRRKELKRDEEPGKLTKMASGVKAGLQSASLMRTENTKAQTREDKLFEEMDPALSGKLAKPIYRDRETGKKRDFKAERREKRKEEKQKAEEEGRYLQWGKGVKQKEMQKEKLEEDLHEMSKPLARYRDDADLDEMLRGQERAGDPMLAFIKKKQSKRGNDDLPEKPQYKGPQPPPNRFGIMPGYRWDGVDRSNGFEKEFFQRNDSVVTERLRSLSL